MKLTGFRNPISDPARRRVLMGRAAAVLCVAMFAFVYLQLASRRMAAQESLTSRTADIRSARTGGIDALNAQELGGLQKGAADFRSGFTRLAEIPSLLDALSDEARKNDVRMLAIRSETPQQVAGDAGTPLEIGGRKLERLPIAMRLQGGTRAIGNFLNSVSRSSKRLFVVERWHMNATTPPAPAGVVCELTVSFFSSGEVDG